MFFEKAVDVSVIAPGHAMQVMGSISCSQEMATKRCTPNAQEWINPLGEYSDLIDQREEISV